MTATPGEASRTALVACNPSIPGRRKSITTTSGRCSRTTSGAEDPSPAVATTEMSGWRPSRSSRASRKTWLSSTRTTRIGSGIRGRLFGRQEQRIVRLAAGLHIDLEVGMTLGQISEEPVEIGLIGPLEERQHSSRLGQEPLCDGAGDLVEVAAAGDRLTVGEPEPVALQDGEAVHLDVARGDRHLSGGDLREDLAHFGRVLGGAALG